MPAAAESPQIGPHAEFGSCQQEAFAYALALVAYKTAMDRPTEVMQNFEDMAQRQQEEFDMQELALWSMQITKSMISTYEPIIGFRPAASELIFCMVEQRKRKLGQ